MVGSRVNGGALKRHPALRPPAFTPEACLRKATDGFLLWPQPFRPGKSAWFYFELSFGQTMVFFPLGRVSLLQHENR